VSCSVHDVIDLEGRGIPGAFVATTEFVAAAAAQSKALGADPARVFVAHPIQDRTVDEVRALAEQAVTELVRALTEPA
jgi:hypothetical protein